MKTIDTGSQRLLRIWRRDAIRESAQGESTAKRMHCHWIRRQLVVSYLVALLFNGICEAAWNTVTGIKDGADTAGETANPWDGERLLVFGSTLNFAGNATLDGELWLQQMNGWGNPVVNIPGTLTMFSPSGQFQVVGGADLNIGNAAESSVEAGKTTINGGSQVTISEMTVHDHAESNRPRPEAVALACPAERGGYINLAPLGLV